VRIGVFGLGYVGCVAAACLAQRGHEVIGVDVNRQKVEMAGAGQSPILEPGLDALMAQVVASGCLRTTVDGHGAVADSDVSLICVGTPSNNNGSLSLRFVEKVCAEIGGALARKAEYHVVIVRSTVLPGTTREVLIPVLEESSGKRAGRDFGVAVNPEFMREGCAIADYRDPSLIVVGEFDRRSGSAVERVHEGLDAAFVHTNLESAEMLKYVNNAFHALKITFANEIGNLCKVHGIDGREVMAILCRDHRLNISEAYLRPGFAFGGSCLPKDVRALLYRAKERDLDCPLLGAVLPSNEAQVRRGIGLVERTGLRKVGVLGLSFKSGTDDVRDSPVIPLVETLIGRGYEVKVFDEHVQLAALIGANRAFLEREIPHIASVMRSSLRDVVQQAEVLVVSNNCPAFDAVPALVREDQVVIDLAGLNGCDANLGRGYEGICW